MEGENTNFLLVFENHLKAIFSCLDKMSLDIFLSFPTLASEKSCMLIVRTTNGMPIRATASMFLFVCLFV